MIVAVCTRLSLSFGTNQIVLSGGVFLNEFILLNTIEQLSAVGLEPFYHQLVPTNDGGISLGQIAVAAAQIDSNRDTNNV